MTLSLTAGASTRATVPPSQRIGYTPVGERVRVTKALAALVGKSEGWCHDRLYRYPKLAELTVAAIQAYRLAGDIKGLAGFTALIRDAMAGAPAPRLTPDLVLSAQTADSNEDVAESAFLLRPCRDTAAAYIRKLDDEMAKSGALRAAIVERYLS